MKERQRKLIVNKNSRNIRDLVNSNQMTLNEIKMRQEKQIRRSSLNPNTKNIKAYEECFLLAHLLRNKIFRSALR